MKMKTLSMMFLLVCLVLCLVACGSVAASSTTSSTSSSTTSSHESTSSSSSSASQVILPQDCSHEGNTNMPDCEDVVECSVCKGDVIAPIYHTYVMPGVHVEGDCTKAGYTVYTCVRCDHTMEEMDEEYGSHQFENGICKHCQASSKVKVEEQEIDKLPMPDKYNTGAGSYLYADRPLAKVTKSGIYNGTPIYVNGDKVGIDYINVDITGLTEYVISDIDFSDYQFATSGTFAGVTEKFVVRFENCKFDTFTTDRDGTGLVYYTLDHCSLNTFNGSNATIEWCYFGGNDYRDGLVPFRNVTVNHCMVGEKDSVRYENEMHTDAIQIYGFGMGKRTVVAENLHFYNFRAMMPAVTFSGSESYTNAILMVSLDYNHAYNISFEHCYIDGGGYPVMVWDNPHPDYIEGYGTSAFEYNHMQDIVYRDIMYGCTISGQPYVIGLKSPLSYVTFGDTKVQGPVSDTTNIDALNQDPNFLHKMETLYVGSVWEKDGKTHFSVSNNTNITREFSVMTPDGAIHQFIIPRAPVASEFEFNLTYAEFPFDIDIEIDGVFDYVVCFDTTCGNYQQIRFVSHTEADVYIDITPLENWTSAKEVYEVFHAPFNNTTYFDITSDGVMTIYGSGAVNATTEASYQSSKYYPFCDQIKEIVVKPGVTGIGNFAFAYLTSLEKVSLPSTLRQIGNGAFKGCHQLKEINLPYGLNKMGDAGFADCLSLKDITIPTTVKSMGSQLFMGCENLQKVVMLASVNTLGANTFKGCYNLQQITLNGHFTSISSQAFAGCVSLTSLVYEGSAGELQALTVGEVGNAHFSRVAQNPTYISYADAAALEDRDLADREPKTPTVSYSHLFLEKSAGRHTSLITYIPYSGSPIDLGMTTDSDGEVTIKWVEGALLLDGAPSDVGRYVAVVKIAETENYAVYEAHLTFAVQKIDAEVTIEAGSTLDKVYDGLPVGDVSYTTNSSSPAELIWYAGQSICDGRPVAPGEYRVVVYVPENHNFRAAQAEIAFTISLPEDQEYWDGSAASQFAGGEGTEASPYEIATPEQLAYLALLINNSATNPTYASAYYTLTNDIYLNAGGSAYDGWVKVQGDMSQLNLWHSIGLKEELAFRGHFDGAGYTIYGLYGFSCDIAGTKYDNGLFGFAVGATIKDLNFRFGWLHSTGKNNYSGFVAAVAKGCTVSGVVVEDCLVSSPSAYADDLFGYTE
ncbi:MAG: leucine-rich repeat protein [Clostridia bacterium]|nr:leucine-rich repeat protein [Clostridia bacterium]